jgi:ABC-type glycerol-3-phosphate transport system substrate-binding protein
MRKIFAILMICMGVFAFASPKITVLVSGMGDFPDGTKGTISQAKEKVQKDFPGLEVELIQMNLSGGSTISMDAMLAAGTPPNVYMDNMVRASKYMVPEFALNLNKYIRDIKMYDKNILAQYTRNKALLGMPMPSHTQGVCINLDIMKEIGFEVKWDWTIDDFLKMAELVKQKYGNKKYATMLFAANQSGDYLLHNWFEAFGAHYYKTGDYDNATIAKTGGAKTYEFYQKLIKNGYVPPNASTLNDDDYALEWSKGTLAATPFFTAWNDVYFKSSMDQKLIEKPFNYKYVPFPHAPGVKGTPGYSMTGAYVVYKSPDENINKISARFVEYATSAEMQSLDSKYSFTVPTRSDAVMPIGPHVEATMRIAKENGIYDCGITDPRFTERRALQFPILQKLFNFKISPEEAIKEYEKKLSAVK